MPVLVTVQAERNAIFFVAAAAAYILLLEHMAVDERSTKVYTALSFIVRLIKHILVA